MPSRRKNYFVQDKFLLESSAVAAVAATTTIPLGTSDGPYIVEKFEIMAAGGYTADASNYYDVSLQSKPVVFTAVAATDLCTSTGHGYQNGDQVQVTNSGGALPTGLSAGVTYFAIVASVDTFKLATTRANALAGTVIDITGAGSGTNSIARVLGMWSFKVGNNGTLADLVFGSGTLDAQPAYISGQLNAVLTKFGTGANVGAGSRLVAHCRQL